MAITTDEYPLLIAAPMLQDYLVDKDTGAPLSAGIVTFYHDNARNVLKNLYYQTGSPGAYTYIELPNPNTLTSVGTIADNNGNDVIPFFFPYDEEDPDIADPYYVTVYSSNSDGSPAVLQFTRENFPFISTQDSGGGSNQQGLVNLIDNGQFSTNINVGTYPDGTASVVVAPGGSSGWQYAIGTGSTGTDSVSFTEFLQEPAGVVGNPDAAINLVCSVTNQSEVKELLYSFNNVNRFASTAQFYTFSFQGMSNLLGPTNVTFAIVKNFGTGGSATSTTSIDEFTLMPGVWNQFNISFVFGDNSAETIGEDSFVSLALVMPPNSTFNLSMTNFILSPGILEFNSFPERADTGVFGSTVFSDSEGDQLYLPLITSPQGTIVDTSSLASIVPSVLTNPGGNLLLCDGSSYVASTKSALGIPYSRLQKILFQSGTNIGLYGGGRTFVNAYITDGITNSIRISTNAAGAQTATVDGAIPTGFSFTSIATGQTANAVGYSAGANSIILRSVSTLYTFIGGISAGTGFTTYPFVRNTSNSSYGTFSVKTAVASGITPGSYVKDSTGTPNFYYWFTINGAGSDPAPGGIGTRINLLSTYTAQEVANCLQAGASGQCVSAIVVLAAASIPAGSFFTFNANSVAYQVYYTIAGSGTAPAGNPIQVALTGTETAAQVATKTITAINSYMLGVPDFRGKTLQGVGSTVYDTQSATRLSLVSGLFGNVPGTLQFTDTDPGSIRNSALGFYDNNFSANEGINWFIRY